MFWSVALDTFHISFITIPYLKLLQKLIIKKTNSYWQEDIKNLIYNYKHIWSSDHICCASFWGWYVVESNLLQIIKALSDENRLRILNLLQHGDLCVCELEILLGISQSNASRHLNKLTNAGILEYYKAAKYIYYKINEKQINEYPFIKQILDSASTRLEVCQRDYDRLSSYKEKGYSCDDLKEGKVYFNS